MTQLESSFISNDENYSHQFDFELVSNGVFDFSKTIETHLGVFELISSQNICHWIFWLSSTPHITNILQQDVSYIKNSNIADGLNLQSTYLELDIKSSHSFNKNEILVTNSFCSTNLSFFLDNCEAVDATDNPNSFFNIGNRQEPFRIARFFQAWQVSDLFLSSASITPKSSLKIDGTKQELFVIFSLLASFGRYTLITDKSFKRNNEWSLSVASGTRTDSNYLQCTQCPMCIPLLELSRISSLKSTIHTVEILSQFSVLHDAECTSRRAIYLLRLEEARKPVEEGKLDFSTSNGICVLEFGVLINFVYLTILYRV